MTDPGLESAAARALELVADGMHVGLGPAERVLVGHPDGRVDVLQTEM